MRAREQHPEMVRLILSGHSEFENTLHAVPFAHQFLAKPCPPDELRTVIDRACSLKGLLGDAQTQATVAGLTSLPAAPGTYQELADALADPETSAAEISEIVERDVALFAKVLQLVNSSFFGLARRITSGRDAVSYLGVATLRTLVLSVDLFRTYAPPRPLNGFSLDALERHSTAVAHTASRLVPSEHAEDAFTAGLLHDVGKLVLAAEQPESLESMLGDATATGRPLHEVERERSGVTHAEIGAYLLGLWGLPYPIVDAVARHHAALDVDEPRLDAVSAVALGDALVAEQEPDGVNRGVPAPVQQDLVDALGSAIDLARSREIATREAGRAFE